VTPPSIKKCSSIMMLEAMLCPIPIGAESVIDGGLVWCWWVFFLLLLSLP